MRVVEKSEDRLVLKDNQLDKKLGISALAVFLLLIAFLFAEGGDWIEASIPIALAAGAQSWTAVMAIRRFIGQDKTDDLPVGWIPDD